MCGPDVRWCGNEAGDCRESEWSVVPKEVFSQSEIAKHSQLSNNTEFREQKLDQQSRDLGSLEVVKNADELIWYPSEVDVSIRPGWFYHEAEDHLVKSIETLKNIYLNSVGGNSLLLLNIPPHTDGYITNYDVERLTQLGEFIRNTFDDNLLKEAKIKVSSALVSHGIHQVMLEDETYWKAEDECGPYTITIEFTEPKMIQYVVMQEQIRLSQRIELFELWAGEVKAGNLIYAGTTIGYKKICKFPLIELKTLRVVIKKYRKSPTLRYMGIYK